MLSTYNSQLNNYFDLAAGIDLRSYTGEHYREVYDLLGGDYYVGSTEEGGKNYIGNLSLIHI